MVLLPHGFTPIADLKASNQPVSLIGTVLAVYAPYKSRGTDFCLEFVLQDDLSLPIGSSQAIISVRHFRPLESQLPSISGIGSVVAVDTIRVEEFNGKRCAVTNWKLGSKIFCYSTRDIPAPEFAMGFRRGGNFPIPCSRSYDAPLPSRYWQDSIIEIRAEAVRHINDIKAYAKSVDRRKTLPIRTASMKMSLISDLDFNKFYDIRCKLVKSFPQNDATVDLYVTDYTENTSLFYYEDPEDPVGFYNSKWQGPYGKLTLQVRLYGSSAAYAIEKVVVGDFIWLRNVRIKISLNNMMEGIVHEDLRNPNKLFISHINVDHDKEDIKRREREYDDKRAARLKPKEPEKPPKKVMGKVAANSSSEKKEMEMLQQELEQQESDEKLCKKAAAERDEERNIGRSHKKLGQQGSDDRSSKNVSDKTALDQSKEKERKELHHQLERRRSKENLSKDAATPGEESSTEKPQSELEQQELKKNRKKSLKKASAASRREEKKEMERRERQLEQQALEQQLEDRATIKLGINTKVRAAFPSIGFSTLLKIINNPNLLYKQPDGSVLNLPFVNCKHRTRVRLVDFKPDDVRGWAVPWDNPRFNNNPTAADRGVFKWRIFLYVEDADPPKGIDPERTLFVCNHENAEHLLEMKACDLQKSPKALKKLEQKLFVLGGNLLELKRKGVKLPLPPGDPQLQSEPFECCVQEYGNAKPGGGYQRLHGIFSTVIKD